MIGKTIGEGTFGKVKLGHHILTGEKVAVKILEKEKIKDSGDAERVSREIKILKVVRHPSIIQLYEIIETPKQFYLIMEYANGGELFDYIVSHGKIKETQACKIFKQVLTGLEYLHGLGIAHRDLKPENLLIDQDFSMKIVDFGLSNMFSPGESLKTACGSPCYAAPEMIAGKRYNGAKADVWSCGVILFALLCGYLPFEDPNTALLYKKILIGDFKFAKWVSAEAKDLIKGILNIHPEERMTIGQIRSHPWSLISHTRPLPLIDRKVEEKVISQLVNYGIDAETAEKNLAMQKHNHVTATYFLLVKKYLTRPARADIITKLYVEKKGNDRKSNEVSPLAQTSRTNTVGRVRTARKYSVTPTRITTAKTHQKPQEPALPKPLNMPKTLSKIYLGTRLYMKDKNKEFNATTYRKSPNTTENVADFSFG